MTFQTTKTLLYTLLTIFIPIALDICFLILIENFKLKNKFRKQNTKLLSKHFYCAISMSLSKFDNHTIMC